MYVGKRAKYILSVLLICGLLVVSIPCRAYAIGPVVLGPALKYAIAAGMVASGVYASNSDGLDYIVQDYWNKASEHIKSSWINNSIYAGATGTFIINNMLLSNITDYLYKEGFDVGENSVVIVQEPPVSVENYTEYDVEGIKINGKSFTLGNRQYGYDGVVFFVKHTLYLGGLYVDEILTNSKGDHVISYVAELTHVTFEENELTVYFGYHTHTGWRTDPGWHIHITYTELASILGEPYTEGTYEEIITETFVVDAGGIGNATSGRPDVKVPCPPVPAAEWPDQWIDDLLDDMNRTGNPTLDDETSIEEWEDEWEWYMDEFGNIYKVKKGQPPRKPDDEPIRIPGPPLPAPDVPENYPTEDDPDLTIEHHPPQTTVTENPDGSRTEITTQTTTTTRRWWDTTAKRWRTTIDETITTTTVDFDPDGNEIGRTTTTTTQPKGEREETAQPDDTAIDWEPLKRGLYELTEKFPFCLPWDLMRGIQSLEASQWDRQIRIDVGDGIWPAMVIDLSMFDNIASITRVILLIIFDLGLIFGTRKLMGGDV